MAKQLILNISLNDDATFDNYFLHKGSDNYTAVTIVKEQLFSSENPFFYLWGANGSGISHLLQASCHKALAQKLSAQYLSLSEFLDYSPEDLLGNLDSVALVCLDNIQAVSGKIHWEKELFSLYNRISDSGGSLLLGSKCSVRELSLALPDLQSRYSSGFMFQLSTVDDKHKLKILQFRALKRGMKLNDDLAKYIIARASREMSSLIHCLDVIGESSLLEQRKLSIPFVRKIFNW